MAAVIAPTLEIDAMLRSNPSPSHEDVYAATLALRDSLVKLAGGTGAGLTIERLSPAQRASVHLYLGELVQRLRTDRIGFGATRAQVWEAISSEAPHSLSAFELDTMLHEVEDALDSMEYFERLRG